MVDELEAAVSKLVEKSRLEANDEVFTDDVVLVVNSKPMHLCIANSYLTVNIVCFCYFSAAFLPGKG